MGDVNNPKVGRKYFTLQDVHREIKVEIGAKHEVSGYCKTYSIWANQGDYEYHQRRLKVGQAIKSFHSGYGDIYKDIPLEDLLFIASILKIEV